MNLSVTELSRRLQKALDNNYNVTDLSTVLEIISILEGTKITKEQLETTRLAKYINQLRRKTTNEVLARRSKNLLKKWRNMLIPTITSTMTNTVATISTTSIGNLSNIKNTVNGPTETNVIAVSQPLKQTENLVYPSGHNFTDSIGKSNNSRTTFANLLTVSPNKQTEAAAPVSTVHSDKSSILFLDSDDSESLSRTATAVIAPTVASNAGIASGYKSVNQSKKSKKEKRKKNKDKHSEQIVKKHTYGFDVGYNPNDSQSNSSYNHFNTSNNKSTISISDLTFFGKFNNSSSSASSSSSSMPIVTQSEIVTNTTKISTLTVQSTPTASTTKLTTDNAVIMIRSNSNSNSSVYVNLPNSPISGIPTESRSLSPFLSGNSNELSAMLQLKKLQQQQQISKNIPLDQNAPIAIAAKNQPKKRGRKKGSKGVDALMAASAIASSKGGLNLSFNYGNGNNNYRLSSAIPTAAAMSLNENSSYLDFKNKIVFSGPKKVKTTKELIADLQNRKIVSSTTSPTLSNKCSTGGGNVGMSSQNFISLHSPSSSETSQLSNYADGATRSTTATPISLLNPDTSDTTLLFGNADDNQYNNNNNSNVNNINTNNNQHRNDQTNESLDSNKLILTSNHNNLFDNTDINVICNSCNTINDEINNLKSRLSKIDYNKIDWFDHDEIYCTCKLVELQEDNMTPNVIDKNNECDKIDDDDENINTNLFNYVNNKSISYKSSSVPTINHRNHTTQYNKTKKPIKSIFDLDYDDDLNSKLITTSKINMFCTELIDNKICANHKLNDHSHDESGINGNIQINDLESNDNIKYKLIEDPNCPAKLMLEAKLKKVTTFHINVLHNFYIPNVNGNWDNVSIKNDANNIINKNNLYERVVPIYNHLIADKIPKHYLRNKADNFFLNHQLGNHKIKCKFKRKSSDTDDIEEQQSNKKQHKIKKYSSSSTTTFTIISSESSDSDNSNKIHNDNDDYPLICNDISVDAENLIDPIKELSSKSKEILNDTLLDKSTSSDKLLKSFINLNNDNIIGIQNSNNYHFKEWYETIQVKSYNDDLLTILPYVVID